MNSLKDEVMNILIKKPATRNSDRKLYSEILKRYAKANGFELTRVDQFFMADFKENGIPDYESVRRSRQKLQADNPEIRAKVAVKKNRSDREKQFKQFALGLGEIPVV